MIRPGSPAAATRSRGLPVSAGFFRRAMENVETPLVRRAICAVSPGLLAAGLQLLLASGCATAPNVVEAPAKRDRFPLDPREEITGVVGESVASGWSALSKNDPRAAAREFEAARREGDGLAAQIGWIESAVLLGRFDEASAACAESLTGGEATVPLLVACGEASGRGGKPVEGHRLYRRALARAGGARPGLKARAEELRIAGRDAMAAEARVALEEKRLAEARERIAVAIDLAPDQSSLRALSGEIEEAGGDLDAAFRRYREAFEMDSKNAVFAERVGDLAVKQGDPALAVSVFDELARSDPKYLARAEEARLAFRVANWPAREREAAGSPRLTRSSAAVLVWWMFPEVREARVSSAVIASDAVSRRDTRAFARAVALGLLEVDRETHRGNPDGTLTRPAAARLLLRLAGILYPRDGPPCLGEAGPKAVRSAAEAIAAAEECGLLEAGETSPPTGPELTRALDRIRALGASSSRTEGAHS
jgi:Flp pilus assembly protein TadD